MLINAIGQLAAAFLATIAFSVLFHVPKKQYIICGLTGTLGWLVYLLAGKTILAGFFQYTGMFCGNCGNRILCTVVCCLAESAVERIYDIRDLSYRPRYRYL